jgi:hypothetical protein
LNPRAGRCLGICAALWLVAGPHPASAGPWMAPGDEALRADVELLADAGIIDGPVTTWPLSWPDVARDVLAVAPGTMGGATGAALQRVQRRARRAMERGFSGVQARLAAAEKPDPLRGFAATPREEGEAELQLAWLGSHLAFGLGVTAAADPDDGQTWRPDGSYLAMNVANVALTAGYLDRWWGPGRQGSLIYSSNARPMPGISLARNYTDPFETRWLSWLGAWSAVLSASQAEDNGVEVGKVRVLAARVAFRPRRWLEFGLSRTAQWCGEGRPCGWSTLGDLVLGRDNQVDDGSTAQQPGNQMAGYDMRLRSPWRALPLAFHTQWIGEDEAGGLPSKFIGQFGLETWLELAAGNLRVSAEYSDTACSFSRAAPDFECAYRNELYPQGYAYRGRPLGHAMDNDSRMYSLGAILVRHDGDSLALSVRRAQLNRDGGPHALGEVPAEREDVELRYARERAWGKLQVSIGLHDSDTPGADATPRGFLMWQQGF